MKSFAFQKRSKEILLHQRANHADRKQWPQKINMSVMTSQYEIAAKITLILSQNVFLQRCNLPARERKIIGTSSMLTCGKSRVFPTASFLHLNDFFFSFSFYSCFCIHIHIHSLLMMASWCRQNVGTIFCYFVHVYVSINQYRQRHKNKYASIKIKFDRLKDGAPFYGLGERTYIFFPLPPIPCVL